MAARFECVLIGTRFHVIDHTCPIPYTVEDYSTEQPAWELAERNNAVLSDRDPRPYARSTHRSPKAGQQA